MTIFILGILAAAALTFVVARWVGPWLLDLLTPSILRAARRIDASYSAQDAPWAKKVSAILSQSVPELKSNADRIIQQFGVRRRSEPPVLLSIIPDSPAKRFFLEFESLSFGERPSLDIETLKVVRHKADKFLIIGRADDESVFYAISREGAGEVYVLSLDDQDRVIEAEDDSPSFEHFLALQEIMHLDPDAQGSFTTE